MARDGPVPTADRSLRLGLIAGAAVVATGGARTACVCGDDGERVARMEQTRDLEADRVHDADQICGGAGAQGGLPPAACPAVVHRSAGLSHRAWGPCYCLHTVLAGSFHLRRNSRG